MTTKIQPVSKPVAQLFLEQCVGSTSGHMAAIPNSPTIQTIIGCHVPSQRENIHFKDFAEFLRQVADQLDPRTGVIDCLHGLMHQTRLFLGEDEPNSRQRDDLWVAWERAKEVMDAIGEEAP